MPLGATIKMNGTALYECAEVLFIAKAYGVEMSVFAQFTVAILALVTSIGVAGDATAAIIVAKMEGERGLLGQQSAVSCEP